MDADQRPRWDDRLGRSLVWLLLGAVSLLLVATVAALGRPSSDDAARTPAVDTGRQTPAFVLDVFVERIDESLGTALLSVTPRQLNASSGEGVPTPGSWQTTNPVIFSFNGSVENSWYSIDAEPVFLPGRVYQPFTVTARLVHGVDTGDRSVLSYPFDSYTFELAAGGLYGPVGSQEPGPGWAPLAVVPRLVGSGDAEFRATAEPPGSWPSTLAFTASRTPGQIVYALAIMVVILASAALIAYMTRRISRSGSKASVPVRPATMQGLVWAAALTFTMVQIRDNYPSDPPIGIAADYVVLLPALAITLTASFVVLRTWVNRSDYESSGHPLASDEPRN